MTEKLGGGVPEQGLPTLKNLDFVREQLVHTETPLATATWAQLYGLDLIDEVERLRAALERPRPALPAPEPPANDGTAWVCDECGTTVTGPAFLTRCPHCEQPTMSRGAALPAEHAPPEPSKEAMRAAMKATAELWSTNASRVQITAAAVEAAYAVDGGSRPARGRPEGPSAPGKETV